MTPVIYQRLFVGRLGSRFVGFFVTDDGADMPVTFRGDDHDELLRRMIDWLEAERAKVGLTAAIIEKRKVALAAARAARQAKRTEA